MKLNINTYCLDCYRSLFINIQTLSICLLILLIMRKRGAISKSVQEITDNEFIEEEGNQIRSFSRYCLNHLEISGSKNYKNAILSYKKR